VFFGVEVLQHGAAVHEEELWFVGR
jgi:hypothetical protein